MNLIWVIEWKIRGKEDNEWNMKMSDNNLPLFFKMSFTDKITV
jgi:hypothetical protein